MMSSSSPATQLQQTIVVELTVAPAGSHSTEQLVEAVAGQRLLVTTRRGPVRVDRGHVLSALRTMHRRGLIARACWPGTSPAAHDYWVLPESPWADRD